MNINFTKDLSINDEMRKELSGPFGRTMKISQIVRSISKGSRIFAVGDVTVSQLLKHGYMPRVAVFDYRTGRKKVNFPEINRAYKNPLKIKNPRGLVSMQMWNAVKRASASKSSFGIKVSGEEDLASLACVYFAKKGTIIMYGLRNKGIVVIKVDKKIKDYVAAVLRKMSAIS